MAQAFQVLLAVAMTTGRDFGFRGGLLFADIGIALIAGLVAVFLQVPALSLLVVTMVALLLAGQIPFGTDRIVNGAQPIYVLATIRLYVSSFNLFTSLHSLFGFGGSNH